MNSKRQRSTLHSRAIAAAALLFVPACLILAQQKTDIPVVDAHLGPCTATFTVKENSKPLYNAKVTVTVRTGAFGMRKTELEVGTNMDGKGRVDGLPERMKKPLQFRIRYGELSKTIEANPSDKCDATFEVDLAAK